MQMHCSVIFDERNHCGNVFLRNFRGCAQKNSHEIDLYLN